MAKNQFGGNRPGGGSRPPFGGGGGGNRNNRRDSRYPSEDDKGQFRLNDQIRVPQIRLVGDNMEQISELVGTEIKSGEVYNTRDALLWAEKSELDLVEISPNAVPPVVRIIDYNKFLYEKKKKEKEIKAKAAKTVIKEIRFGPNTDDHDFEFKVRHAKTFLEENSKVKAYVNFRGRTIVFKDRGELLLLKFLKELEEFGSPESLPKLEGRRMIVMIAPKKKK
ncbi:translation initiation factor IF-3 [Haliscomenobacter sp.]|uniref:translation initiation factor IF-3 n=1 Tax=Haliscomenobacter sp. TaxID=2717303 RepID=UPI003BAB68E4